MAETTAFGKAIIFLRDLGVYDVILPFLLIFTILFAILERTRVLGTENVGGENHPRKNLNAMVAFVIAFLVVASSRLVAIINEALANTMLLLLLVIFFIVLIGVFYEEGKPVILETHWKIIFSILMFIGITAIFLWAVKIESNSSYCSDYAKGECPWLAMAFGWLADQWDSTAVASIVMFIVIILLILFVTSDKKPSGSSGGNSGGGESHH